MRLLLSPLYRSRSEIGVIHRVLVRPKLDDGDISATFAIPWTRSRTAATLDLFVRGLFSLYEVHQYETERAVPTNGKAENRGAIRI